MPVKQRRRRPVDDEDPEDGVPSRQRANRRDPDNDFDNDSEDGMDVDGEAGSSADDQLAKKLVRYALSCEYSRTPIRRDGIKERGKENLCI
ncbi:hypothetical protein E5D57_002103 [Metarhizium anisopliae]|nr:hypothetical protein E5D57_002103 [Metarhizium anisopliae]